MIEETDQASDSRERVREFEQQAAEPPAGLLAEFAYFLRHNKRWWLTPIILVLLAVAVLVWLSASGLPFIYPI